MEAHVAFEEETVTQALEEPPAEVVDVDAELAQLGGELAVLHTPLAPRVDIVIVSHNSLACLERNLDAIEAAARELGGLVIVADNASTDGTVDHLLERGSDCLVVAPLPDNRGYAAGVNAAVACSDADHVVILNPDVQLPSSQALIRLVGHLEQHPEAAVVAPRLLDPDGSIQSSARCTPSIAMLLARQTGFGRTRLGRRLKDRYLELPHPSVHSRVEWALGAALAVRRSDFDRVGGFDERFFLYFEDVDFCTRLNAISREVHYLPGVALMHEHARSSAPENGSLLDSRPRRTHLRSAVRFYLKHPLRVVRWGDAVRRALDVALSASLLALLSPLLLIAALAIRLDSKGPVVFKQRRVGRRGVPFTIFKFRTMESDAERILHDHIRRHVLGVAVGVDRSGLPIFKLYPEERITRVGGVLRRWSIDELPQLVNVLRGDMTLVGFRPPLPQEVDHYPSWYHRRFALKPGLTGLWQVSGRNEKSYEDMVRYDIEYAERRSWKLDLTLLFRTLPAVLRRRGAY